MRNCETLHTKLFEPEATNVVGLAAPAAASISSSSSCSIGSVRFVGDRTENTTAASAASAVLFYSATIMINYHVCASENDRYWQQYDRKLSSIPFSRKLVSTSSCLFTRRLFAVIFRHVFFFVIFVRFFFWLFKS